MVKPRSIFINCEHHQQRIADAVGEILGQELVAHALEVGLVHRCRVLDIEFSLFGDHGLEDDGGIEFTRYTHQLRQVAFEVGLRARTFAAVYESISLFLAERTSSILGCETIVVENLQRKVAEFGQ